MRGFAAVAALIAFAPACCLANYEAGKKAFDSWDIASAVRSLIGSASSDGRSALLLAEIYGLELHGNRAESDTLFRKHLENAARLGNAEGKRRLGLILVNGGIEGAKPSPADIRRGLGLLGEACAMGSADACSNVANLHAGKDAAVPLTADPLPEEFRSLAKAKEFGKLWHKAALRDKNPARLHGELVELSISAGSAWSDVDLETGAAYHWVAGCIGEGVEPPAQEWPPRFRALTPAQQERAVQRGMRLEIELGLRPQVFDPAPRMAARIAGAFERELAMDERALVRTADSLAALAIAGGEVPRSTMAMGWDRAVAKVAGDFKPFLIRYRAARADLLAAERLEPRVFLADKLAINLKQRQLHQLDVFFASPTGRRYIAFRGAIAEVMHESAMLGARRRYDALRAGQRPAPVAISNEDEGHGQRIRSEFMSDHIVRIGQARSLDGMLTLMTSVRAAGQRYEAASRMLSLNEMQRIKGIEISPAWQALAGGLEDWRETTQRHAKLKELGNGVRSQLAQMLSASVEAEFEADLKRQK